jgi:hypothetical protein
MAHARARGKELRELEERRKKVHLKTIGSWIALAVCIGSILVAWNEATRLVWLGVTPFALVAVWISIRTEKEIDSRMQILAPDSATSAGFIRKGSAK